MKPLIAGLALTLASLLPSSHATSAQDVQSFELKNGMTFLVLEDHSIPNANMYTFWQVGSRNEFPGITGLSHFFEHMMFNGSKKFGPKMFDRTMEAAGGANNAYTTENSTVYTDWFPADAMETIFDLESDRIANLDLNDEVIQSERGVVTSERSTGLENSNFRALHGEVKGAAFIAHPYSWGVIGHQSDIDNWSKQDLIDYYKTYYAPNNATVVIAGDIEFDKVKALAKKYFADIPRGKTPRKIHTVEPEQKGEKRVFVLKPSVSSANLMLAYKVPATDHKDYYALTLMNSILGQGRTSRLYRALVEEQQLATSVSPYMPQTLDPNLLYFYAVASKGTAPEKLEKAIYRIFEQIKAEGVSAEELQKAKNGQIMAFYKSMETINGKANTIGSYDMYFGGFEALFSASEQYKAVTIQDIKRVANTYLKRSKRTVGILDKKEATDFSGKE